MDRENKDFVLAKLKDFAEKLLGHTVFILLLALTVWASIMNWHGTDHAVERFFYLILAMLGGLCTGGCFIKLYLPRIVGFFADSLLSPKQYLQKAAPLLSHPRNLILQKKFSEAEESLLTLLEEYPAESSIVLMLLEMYVHTCDRRKGELLCCDFFASEKRSISPQNLKILLLYLDILAEEHRFIEALERIHTEEKSKFYSKEDRISLAKRAEGIRTMLKTAENRTM